MESGKNKKLRKSHEKILVSAGKELRKTGLKNSSVSKIMGGAGMTVGGFYAHFNSKEQLIQDTFANLVTQSSGMVDRMPGNSRAEKAAAFLKTYLSDWHRDTPSEGCPIAALAGEMGREGDALRKSFAEGLQNLAHSRAQALLGSDDPAAVEKALFILSTYVGGLILSRATRGHPISEALLNATRSNLERLLA